MFPSHKDACKVLNDTISRTKLDDKKYDILSDDENNDKSSQNLLGHRPEKSDLSNLKEMKESDKFSSIRPAPLNLKSLNTNLSKNSMGGENIAEIKGRKRHEEQRHITIGFENIVYSSSRQLSLSRDKKIILNGLNGEFRSGELSAIMGPSGAGKSTLMDILSGYTTKLENGNITINGQPRDIKLYRRQTGYIMQNDALHTHITAWEAMQFSVNLKIGNHLNKSEKKLRIEQILEAIGLFEVRHTRTGQLSGGQRKRLAIALELVDNPPVMFLDEPTSGLDSSMSTQLILLLKELAQEGRTIICTIHQPSAIVFGLFDHLYAIAEGQCIYSGDTQLLVPYLTESDLICPKTYNPADYLLEISTHDYGMQNDKLVSKIQNGKNNTYRKCSASSAEAYAFEIAGKMMESGVVTPVKAPSLPLSGNITLNHADEPLKTNHSTKKPKIISFHLDTQNFCRSGGTYATSFCCQWYYLMLRSFLCLYRDKSLAATRLIIHLCISLMIGVLYFGIGNNAYMMFNNFRYIFLSIMFLMFTSFSTMTIIFPLDLPIITREHFNRWYSIKAYYFALTFADLPVQITCVLVFVTITYLMTAQPLEAFRVGIFFSITFLVTLVSQGWGMVVGAVCGVKMGQIFGPFVIAPFMIFSGFFLRFADAHPSLHWLFHISYLKYALEGAVLALFGFNRPKLNCDEIYCHYRIPKKFMKFIDMQNSDLITVFSALITICIFLRILAYFIMSIRIKMR